MPEARAEDDRVIAYDRWGRRDGPPALLLQGLGMDSRGWALQRMAFGRRYRCFAPDNRGVGRTGLPGPHSLDQMASDALAVLDAEGVSRAHVVGASMGGVIAQIIGVMHPERTLSLVLACTSCRHHQWRRELLQEWADAVQERGSTAALGDDGLRWLVGPRLRKRFGMWLNILARILLHSEPDGFAAQVRAILNAPDELRFELRRVRVPALVITGSQDALTPIGDAEELAEMIPLAQLVEMRGAAHGLMVESPNAFNGAVLDFLDRVSGFRTEALDEVASA